MFLVRVSEDTDESDEVLILSCHFLHYFLNNSSLSVYLRCSRNSLAYPDDRLGAKIHVKRKLRKHTRKSLAFSLNCMNCFYNIGMLCKNYHQKSRLTISLRMTGLSFLPCSWGVAT